MLLMFRTDDEGVPIVLLIYLLLLLQVDVCVGVG
jgi:hypothetical protein